MKIINAITHFPKNRTKVNTNETLPLDDIRPVFSSQDLVLDTTLPIVRQLLEEVKYNPLDIDLILNITLTPDRLFQDKTIGVPRIAHPIHYLIGAENAFVIDIHESDWNSAFAIAKSFMVDLNKKNVLLIRSEFLHTSVHPDYETGFNIPDGIALILAEADANKPLDVTYKNLKTETVFCRYDMLPKGEELALGTFRSRLSCEANVEYIEDMNATGQEFLNSLLQKNEIDGLVFESWFPAHSVSCDNEAVLFKSKQENDTFQSLGAFSLPHYLRTFLHNNTSKTIGNICYSPFLNRYSSMLLTV